MHFLIRVQKLWRNFSHRFRSRRVSIWVFGARSHFEAVFGNPTEIEMWRRNWSSHKTTNWGCISILSRGFQLLRLAVVVTFYNWLEPNYASHWSHQKGKLTKYEFPLHFELLADCFKMMKSSDAYEIVHSTHWKYSFISFLIYNKRFLFYSISFS